MYNISEQTVIQSLITWQPDEIIGLYISDGIESFGLTRRVNSADLLIKHQKSASERNYLPETGFRGYFKEIPVATGYAAGFMMARGTRNV